MTGQQLTNRPPRRVIRQLAEVRAENEGVLSVYLDLDPSIFPTLRDREIEIESINDEIVRVYLDGDIPHDEKQARMEAIERIRETLGDRDLVRDKARALAIFAAPSVDVFEVVRVGHAVPPMVVKDETVFLRPLANEAGPRTWAVLLVDKRRARLLYGGERRLLEIDSFEENVPGHQKQGGWSAEKYQRHADEAASEHLDHAAQRLFEFFEHTLFDGLLIAAPDPIYDEMCAKLHAYLKERLRGRLHIGMFPTAQQVLDEAAPLFADARERSIAELLHTIDDAPRGRVATGATNVFGALFERRVDKLVVRDDFATPGVRCPECGWLGLNGPKCPYDGRDTEESPDVIDDAIDATLLQAARVIVVDPDAGHEVPDKICALLRY